MTAQGIINRDFNIKWSVEDFVYAYCQANGFNYDYLCDYKREEFTKNVIEMIESKELGLRGLRDAIIEDINERLVYLF